MAYKVEVREVDQHVYDGTTGAQIDTVSRFELGTEVDGVWINFASRNADKVAQEVAAAKAQEAGESGSGVQGDTGAPSMAPNAAKHGKNG